MNDQSTERITIYVCRGCGTIAHITSGQVECHNTFCNHRYNRIPVDHPDISATYTPVTMDVESVVEFICKVDHAE